MRFRHQEPVEWPTAATMAAAVAGARARLATSTIDAGGFVTLPGADGPVGSRRTVPRGGLRLVSGDHLATGARYALDRADLGGATAEVVLTEGGATAGTATYRCSTGVAELRWSLVGEPRLDVHVDLEPLHVEAQAQLQGPVVARLDARLPWVRVRAAGSVHGPSMAQTLELGLVTHGAGVWRPLVGPLLALPQLEEALRDFVVEQARLATALHRGRAADTVAPVPPAPPAIDRDAVIDAGYDAVEAALVAVDDQVGRLHWWLRTPARWRREVAASQSDHPVLVDGFAAQIPMLVAGNAAASTPHRRRRTAIHAAVDAARLRAHVAQAAFEQRWAAQQAEREAARQAAVLVRPETPLADDLDLSWLASPVTMVRHVKELSSDEEARAAIERMGDGRA